MSVSNCIKNKSKKFNTIRYFQSKLVDFDALNKFIIEFDLSSQNLKFDGHYDDDLSGFRVKYDI